MSTFENIFYLRHLKIIFGVCSSWFLLKWSNSIIVIFEIFGGIEEILGGVGRKRRKKKTLTIFCR